MLPVLVPSTQAPRHFAGIQQHAPVSSIHPQQDIGQITSQWKQETLQWELDNSNRCQRIAKGGAQNGELSQW